jgi:hypothetical protein
MEWQRLILTHAQIEQEGILSRLKDQFLAIFMKTADTTDMALLSDAQYQNERISIYFSPLCSPACDTLMRFYGAAPCNPPSRGAVFVLAGDDDVLDSLG